MSGRPFDSAVMLLEQWLKYAEAVGLDPEEVLVYEATSAFVQSIAKAGGGTGAAE